MKFIRIRNWAKYQHYKDRNPPWIKLHGELMTSIDWVASTDASRILMIALMTLAAKLDNKIPYDASYIKRVCYLNGKPDFTQLLELQFIEIIDNSQLASTEPIAASDEHEMLDQRQSTEEEEEEETEIEAETEKHSAATQPVLVEADSAEKAVKRVWDYYHRKFQRNERYTLTNKRKAKGLARYLDCLKLARGDPEQAALFMKQAVDAMAGSQWHINNAQISWELLFRSTEKLQEWLDKKQVKANGKSEQRANEIEDAGTEARRMLGLRGGNLQVLPGGARPDTALTGRGGVESVPNRIIEGSVRSLSSESEVRLPPEARETD